MIRFEAGRHAVVAVAGDVQIGWCTKRNAGWYIEDMDGENLAGPFHTLRAASKVADKVLARFAAASNPDW
jgi:hypothetical protein